MWIGVKEQMINLDNIGTIKFFYEYDNKNKIFYTNKIMFDGHKEEGFTINFDTGEQAKAEYERIKKLLIKE